MKAVKIRPRSNMKSVPRSDTLWGLLVFVIKRLYGNSEVESLLNKFRSSEANLPFVVSSCFYFEENMSDTTYFLPKPLSQGLTKVARNVEQMSLFKKYKRQKFVRKEVFECLINGEKSDNDLFEEFALEVSLQNEEGQYGAPFLTFANLHNSIDRMRGTTLEVDDAGQLYWEAEVSFRKGSGLYFLVDGDCSLITPALRYLSDIGFGGNNSIGKGAFDFEIEDFVLRSPVQGNSQVTLSLFSPLKEEIEAIQNPANKCWYELIFRQGFNGKDFAVANQKNSNVVFGEGAYFQSANKFRGRLIKTSISGNHDVYSNYLAFTVKSI